MRLLTITALLSGALLASPAPASSHVWHGGRHHAKANRRFARGHDQQGPLTFSGSCEFSGIVRFEPPLTNTPQTVSDFARARGTCSGTLTDQSGRSYALSDTPVGYLASDQGANDSCLAGPESIGTGEFRFPQGSLRFHLSESRVGGAAELSLTGDQAGSASGEADSTANPTETAQACAGSGLREAPVDIRIGAPTITG